MKREVLLSLIVLLLVLLIFSVKQKLRNRSAVIEEPCSEPNQEPVIDCSSVLPCETSGTLSALSHSSFLTPFVISGDNWAYDNYQFNTYTFNDDVTRTNGGYLFLYDAPSDATPHPGGPGNASILNPPNQGLKIIDYPDFVSFPNAHQVWLPFDGGGHFIPSYPQNCSTSPDDVFGGYDDSGTMTGYTNQTIGVTEWIDATNVNFVDNGTSVDVTWDPIPCAEEYAISLTYTGTTGKYTCFGGCEYVSDIQFEFGKIISAGNTSTNITVAQAGIQYVAFWRSIENIQARVVGYALCNKSEPISGCAGVYFA